MLLESRRDILLCFFFSAFRVGLLVFAFHRQMSEETITQAELEVEDASRALAQCRMALLQAEEAAAVQGASVELDDTVKNLKIEVGNLTEILEGLKLRHRSLEEQIAAEGRLRQQEAEYIPHEPHRESESDHLRETLQQLERLLNLERDELATLESDHALSDDKKSAKERELNHRIGMLKQQIHDCNSKLENLGKCRGT